MERNMGNGEKKRTVIRGQGSGESARRTGNGIRNTREQNQVSGVRCQGSRDSEGQVPNARHLGSHPTPHSPLVDPQCCSAFTLIELMVVITLILILATFAMPMYHLAVVHAREAVLRDDLFTMRKMIDEYTIDKQAPPSSLDDLVTAGYLRGGVPVDPFTGSNETWRTDTEDVPISPDQSTSGIVDVHSGSDDQSLDGTPYSSW